MELMLAIGKSQLQSTYTDVLCDTSCLHHCQPDIEGFPSECGKAFVLDIEEKAHPPW
jgi:hypothetical protein